MNYAVTLITSSHVYAFNAKQLTEISLAKLLVNIGLMPAQLTMGPMEVACSLEDKLRFSDYLGDRVALGYYIIDNGPLYQFATATLDRFTTQNNLTLAVFSRLTFLTTDIEQPVFASGAVFSELPDMSDTIPIYDTPLAGADEAVTTFEALDIYGQIGRHVRETANNLCAFCGLTVLLGEGSATLIRPIDDGGRVHVRNFIYLQGEPSRLFNRFAWTVGPDMEIIADAWATGTDVLSTINPNGKLLVGDDQRHWPDERALAWHRQRFFDRLR